MGTSEGWIGGRWIGGYGRRCINGWGEEEGGRVGETTDE